MISSLPCTTARGPISRQAALCVAASVDVAGRAVVLRHQALEDWTAQSDVVSIAQLDFGSSVGGEGDILRGWSAGCPGADEGLGALASRGGDPAAPDPHVRAAPHEERPSIRLDTEKMGVVEVEAADDGSRGSVAVRAVSNDAVLGACLPCGHLRSEVAASEGDLVCLRAAWWHDGEPAPGANAITLRAGQSDDTNVLQKRTVCPGTEIEHPDLTCPRGEILQERHSRLAYVLRSHEVNVIRLGVATVIPNWPLPSVDANGGTMSVRAIEIGRGVDTAVVVVHSEQAVGHDGNLAAAVTDHLVAATVALEPLDVSGWPIADAAVHGLTTIARIVVPPAMRDADVSREAGRGLGEHLMNVQETQGGWHLSSLSSRTKNPAPG